MPAYTQLRRPSPARQRRPCRRRRRLQPQLPASWQAPLLQPRWWPCKAAEPNWAPDRRSWQECNGFSEAAAAISTPTLGHWPRAGLADLGRSSQLGITGSSRKERSRAGQLKLTPCSRQYHSPWCPSCYRACWPRWQCCPSRSRHQTTGQRPHQLYGGRLRN